MPGAVPSPGAGESMAKAARSPRRRSAIARRARGAAVPALVLAGVAYIAYHSVNGDRGALAWMRLESEIGVLAKQVAETRAERLALENRVTGLRPESLDPDLLEERAALVLNLGRAEDRVLLAEPEKP